MLSAIKTLQALYYIQHNAPSKKNKYNIMYLLKLLYFSDRYHLRHFDSIASEDTYYAMKNGPVAYVAFNVLKVKFPLSLNLEEIPLISKSITPLSEYEVQIKKQDDNELSKKFKQSLNFSLETFGKYGQGKYGQFVLSEITHIYPEWKKHEKSLKAGRKFIVMNLEDFHENPDGKEFEEKMKKLGLDLKRDPFQKEDADEVIPAN
jgi:uncharacterized phage-associated protein